MKKKLIGSITLSLILATSVLGTAFAAIGDGARVGTQPSVAQPSGGGIGSGAAPSGGQPSGGGIGSGAAPSGGQPSGGGIGSGAYPSGPAVGPGPDHVNPPFDAVKHDNGSYRIGPRGNANKRIADDFINRNKRWQRRR